VSALHQSARLAPSQDDPGSAVTLRGPAEPHGGSDMNDDTCSVDGCELPVKRKRSGLCYGHYMRQWRYGDTDSRVRFKPGGAVTSNGYKLARAPGHVLKIRLEHRVVLFDAIGFGPHQCSECERHVNWQSPIPDRLCVDHIDEDKLNNNRANLRHLCHSCNIKRNREQLPNGAGFSKRT